MANKIAEIPKFPIILESGLSSANKIYIGHCSANKSWFSQKQNRISCKIGSLTGTEIEENAYPESSLNVLRHVLIVGVECVTKVLFSRCSSSSGGQECSGEKFEIHFFIFDNFSDFTEFIYCSSWFQTRSLPNMAGTISDDLIQIYTKC